MCWVLQSLLRKQSKHVLWEMRTRRQNVWYPSLSLPPLHLSDEVVCNPSHRHHFLSELFHLLLHSGRGMEAVQFQPLGCVVVGFGETQKQRVGSLAKPCPLSCESHLALLGMGPQGSSHYHVLWGPNMFWRMGDLSVNDNQAHRCDVKLLWAPKFYLPQRHYHPTIAPWAPSLTWIEHIS